MRVFNKKTRSNFTCNVIGLVYIMGFLLLNCLKEVSTVTNFKIYYKGITNFIKQK